MDQQFFIRTTQTIPLEKLHLDKLQKYNRRKVIIDLVQVHHRSHRSYKIVNELIPLIKEQPLFYPFANNYRVINQVCQKIQYRTFHKGQTIYKLKERGDYFYLLLQGTVHLTVPQVIRTVILKLVVELLEQKSNSSPSQRQLLSAFLDIHDTHPPANTQETITQSQATQNNPVEQVQKIIQIVEQGQSFGQMMQDSNLRLTNAVAAEDCHVLYLDKKSYEILLKAQLKSQNQSKYNFLEQLPIFKESAPFAISRISVMMKQQKYVYGQTLFRCGDIIKNIYIVKHGSFKLLRKINRHFRLTTFSKIQYKIDTENKKNAEYLIINEGEVLGDIQTIEMKNNYQESCICQSQDATVLTIDKKQLFKILLEDEDNFAKVKEIIATKNVWKNKIVNSFVEKRNRNSLMNSFLSNQKRTITEVSKQSRESSFREEIQNETFFYNQFNRTIDSTPSKCRFSISKPKSRTDNEPKNLFVPRNKKKQGVPHGIEDIVSLVKLKTQFQKRFRRDRKQKCLFKFNKDEVPLYIKTRFSKFQ